MRLLSARPLADTPDVLGGPRHDFWAYVILREEVYPKNPGGRGLWEGYSPPQTPLQAVRMDS